MKKIPAEELLKRIPPDWNPKKFLAAATNTKKAETIPPKCPKENNATQNS